MKLFVWDFHGVLEKGNDHAVVEITNEALQQSGYSRKMTCQEGEFLSGRRWHEYFAFLLPGLDIKEYFKLQALCIDISLNQPERIAKHIQINDYAHEVLEIISRSGHTQILISNTQPESLDLFVNIVGVQHYFPSSHRFGIDTHTQKHITKKDVLEAFLENKNFSKGIISIGDSPGDMALIHGRANGIGYLYAHSGRAHRLTECHYKIADLREVLKEVN